MAGISLNQIGAENLTVSTTSVPPVLVSGRTVAHALIYVGANPIRWMSGATDPTATTGIFVAAGEYIDFTDPNGDYRGLLKDIEFIRDTTASGDAVLSCAWFD